MPLPHPPEQVAAWLDAGTVCRICGGSGIAQQAMTYWYHRSWRPSATESCWYCDGDGRLDPIEHEG